MNAKRRAAAGNTHDPWPCCQAEVGIYGRPKGTICRDCRSLIDEGKAARNAIGPDLTPYTWTKVRHGWPRFYGSGARIPSQIHDVLGDSFFDLVQLITRPAPANTPWHPPGDVNEGWPKVLSHEISRSDAWMPGWRCLILADPKAVAVLDALHWAILAALEAVYAEGKERGGSALFGLASGELSLNDFDETLNPRKDRDR